LDDSGLIINTRKSSYAFIDTKKKKIAIIKLTRDYKEIFLTSFRDTTNKDIKKLEKNSIGKLL